MVVPTRRRSSQSDTRLYCLWTDAEDYACSEVTSGRGMGEEQEEGSGEMITHL